MKKLFGDKNGLVSIKIPQTVTSIGNFAFFECSSLKNIEIPAGVTHIGNNAFDGCTSLEDVEIPEGIKKIGYGVFNKCNKLSKIEIPESVTSIGNLAFSECSNLEKIIIANNEVKIEDYAFWPTRENLIIYCKGNSTAEAHSKLNSIFYQVDDTAPAVDGVEGNLLEWTAEGVTLTINAKDKQVGLAEKAYSFDGGETWQAENTKIYTENASDIVIKTRDALRNIYTHEAINITKIDKEFPTIESVTGNPEEWSKENVTLAIKAKDDLSGLAKMPYSFDGGETWQKENTKIYEKNTDGIVIQVKDKAGNITTNEAVIDISKIDNDFPTIEGITGNPTEWTAEDVILTINGAEDQVSGLAEEPYSFDGGATWTASNTAIYEKNTEGIKIQIRDKVGNISTYEAINITKIDKEAPVVEVLLENPTEWTSEDVTITINAQDRLTELAEEPYSFDGGISWMSSNTIMYAKNVSGIIIQVKDKLGNTYTHEPISITKIAKQEMEISSEKYNIDDMYISNIDKNTTVNLFKESLQTAGVTEISIYSRGKKLSEENKIGTGMEIEFKAGEETKKLTLIVKGDVDGDGDVTFKDTVLINKARLNKQKLKEPYLLAVDSDKDGKVSLPELVKINKLR